MKSPAPPLWLPKPPEIGQTPEYAILAALDVTLELACFTLIAQHPQICDQDPDRPVLHPGSPEAIALMICFGVRDLQEIIGHYRAAVDRANAESFASTDLPF